jgi:hypothetical protein
MSAFKNINNRARSFVVDFFTLALLLLYIITLLNYYYNFTYLSVQLLYYYECYYSSYLFFSTTRELV